MTAWQLFLTLDFTAAVAIAAYAGWLYGRTRGYDRGYRTGYRAGTASAGRVARRYFDERAEPTVVESRR